MGYHEDLDELEGDEDTRPAVGGPYRAFRPFDEQWGRLFGSFTEALRDARRRERREPSRSTACWVVAAEDPEAPGRAVTANGETLWPTHGRGCGSVRWPSD